MAEMESRIVAVDWSGDKKRGPKNIWLAEIADGEVFRLENGRTRERLIDHLIDHATSHPNLIVGFDFAFGMPSWFAESHGALTAPEFWEVVAERGETWLKVCPHPFWGRKEREKAAGVTQLRRTEQQVEALGLQPSSTFKIGGVGHVGTMSLRGMPLLRKLRTVGWQVWPFDPPSFPMAIEIYPRLLMGAVIKSSEAARSHYLMLRYPELDSSIANLAAEYEHAFDALVSALVMNYHQDALLRLPWPVDAVEQLEGRIWDP